MKPRDEWMEIQKVKAQLIQELNGILGMANFYDAQFWLSNKARRRSGGTHRQGPEELADA